MSLRTHKLWLTAAALGLLLTATAHAEVKKKGAWPDDDSEKVTLSFEGPRSKALRALASAAGWSIIDNNPNSATFTGDGDAVSLFVTDQPAVKVLEMLLHDGDYVVKRDGKLVVITVHAQGHGPKQADDSLPPPPPFNPDPPASQGTPRLPTVKNAQDRNVFGSKAVIAKDEVVNNLSVLGGSTDLYGIAQEDVLVMGGSLKIHQGAHVYGDVSVLGGTVELENGSQVDGDLSTAGGHISKAEGAIVKGDQTSIAGKRSHDKLKIKAKDQDDEDDEDDDDNDDNDDEDEESAAVVKADEPWSFGSVLDKLGGALSRTALLYAFGCILLATAGKPMETMQKELTERPMRAFGIGLAALVAGSIGVVALCVTIVGIPVAILVLLVGALGVYAGMCAVFLELGALVLEERTPSPYVHLALGCFMYLIFSTLPFVGWLATALAVVCGLGILVSTRFAGLIRRPPQLTSPAAP
jgi:hypothetical protein